MVHMWFHISQCTMTKYVGLPIPAHVSLPTIMPPLITNLQSMTSITSSPLAWQHLTVRRTSSKGSTFELNIRKCQNKFYSLQPFWAVGANNPDFSMSKISSKNRNQTQIQQLMILTMFLLLLLLFLFGEFWHVVIEQNPVWIVQTFILGKKNAQVVISWGKKATRQFGSFLLWMVGSPPTW